MNGIATARARARRRLAPIVAGIFALLGSSVVTAPAHAGYDEGYYPCSYRCGYPVHHYYPAYRYRYGCYSCGRHLIYERRYVEREYVERRYGYGGGYRHHYGFYPYRPRYGYYPHRRHYGYYPYEGYRPSAYGYGGVGRRWPVPYPDGDAPYAERYEDPPRPPAPIWDGREY